MLIIRNILDKTIEFLCIFLFSFMTVVGTYQIVTRYVFNSPSTRSEELLTYSFTWMSLLAASYVFGKRDHMKMAFFAEKLSEKGQYILNIITEILIIIFSVSVLIYGGITITELTLTQKSASLSVPMGYIYMIIPVCGIITVIYNILNLKDLLFNKEAKK